MALLSIKNLHASVEGIPILKGVNLTIYPGEIHVIMGPNGAGKSTLAKVLAGHPAYEVTEGSVEFLGQDVLGLEPEERARLGMFVSFQYSPEISGVTTREFLYQALKARKEISPEEFDRLLMEKIALMMMRSDLVDRSLNEGFSGGEKKRSEMLQMALFEPYFAVLDETDSGLDIDALRHVAEGIKKVMNPEKGLLIITHYQRLLEYIPPHFVHIFAQGRLVTSGGADLAMELELKGYDYFKSS